MEKAQTKKRRFQGTVTKSAMDKTVVVRVDRVVIHPTYKKRYTVSRKYPVHDANGTAKVGDTVKFEECRPLSKHKRWRLLNSVKR